MTEESNAGSESKQHELQAAGEYTYLTIKDECLTFLGML
jgi:hypothetical protein